MTSRWDPGRAMFGRHGNPPAIEGQAAPLLFPMSGLDAPTPASPGQVLTACKPAAALREGMPDTHVLGEFPICTRSGFFPFGKGIDHRRMVSRGRRKA
jgi:hypothetical protein